jgi:hypothetical protein
MCSATIGQTWGAVLRALPVARRASPLSAPGSTARQQHYYLGLLPGMELKRSILLCVTSASAVISSKSLRWAPSNSTHSEAIYLKRRYRGDGIPT